MFMRCFALMPILAVACAASAQAQNKPIFFDQRRLPDMEVERRKQEVQFEQRRIAEERRADTEAAARAKQEESKLAAEAEGKRKADQARFAQEADAKRKADEEKRVADAAEAKRKADEEKRIADAAEAKRKADEEKRVADAADAKRKADEEKRVADAAEAKRKADEEKRVADAAEAKRKADEEKRVADAAEAKRKADEEKRVADAAEAKRKADEEKRVADAAEAKRKADEENRRTEEIKLAAQAEAKRKAEDARLANLAAAAEAAAKAAAAKTAEAQPAQPSPTLRVATLNPQVTQPTIAAPSPAPGAAASASQKCEPPKVNQTAVPAGRVQIMIDSPCRRGERLTVEYAGFGLAKKFDASGKAEFTFDLFAGKSQGATLVFADGRRETIATADVKFDEVSKLALIWQSPVDLDLHALEGGAALGKPGRWWSGQPSTYDAAVATVRDTGRGAGFMSTVSAGGDDATRIEVYTFIHSPEQDSGAVTMALDYATRGAQPSGDTCGSGPLAEVPFDVVIFDRKGQLFRESGLITAAKCGETLAGNSRYLRQAVPDLRFRR